MAERLLHSLVLLPRTALVHKSTVGRPRPAALRTVAPAGVLVGQAYFRSRVVEIGVRYRVLGVSGPAIWSVRVGLGQLLQPAGSGSGSSRVRVRVRVRFCGASNVSNNYQRQILAPAHRLVELVLILLQ